MATIKYTSLSGEWDNGDKNGLFYAGAYVTYKANTTMWGGISGDTWIPGSNDQKRRFFGSEKISDGYAYTYSAGIKFPKGKDFKITLKIGGKDDFSASSSAFYCAYTTTKQTAGTKNNPGSALTLGVSDSAVTGELGRKSFTLGDSVTFNLGEQYSEKTVYFFFWGRSVSSYKTIRRFSSLSASLDYTPYTPVGDSTITSVNSDILVPGGSFTATISSGADGTNNPVSKYRIYFSTSKTVTSSSSYVDIPKSKLSGNNLTITYANLSNPARGSTIYLGIQTIGSYSGYDAQLTYDSKNFIKINNAPTAPTVDYLNKTVPANGADFEIQINNYSSTDADGHAISYFYAKSNSSNASDNSLSWSPIPEDRILICNLSQPYLYYRAYDGYEYSSKSMTSLAINAGPVDFSIKKVTGDGYRGLNGANYTRKVSVEGQGAAGYEYEWSYKYSNESSYTFIGTGLILNNIDLHPGEGPIEFKLSAIDIFSDKAYQTKESALRYIHELDASDSEIILYGLKDQQNAEGISQFSRDMSARVLFSKLTKDRVFVQKVRMAIKDRGESETVAQFDIVKNDFNSTQAAVEHDFNLTLDKKKTANLSYCDIETQFIAINENEEEMVVYTESKEIEFIPLFSDVFETGNAQAYLDLKDNQPQDIIINAGPAICQITDILIYLESPSMNKNYDIRQYVTFKIEDALVNSILTIEQPRAIFQTARVRSDQDYVFKAYIFPINILGECAADLNNISEYINEKNTLLLNYKVLYNSLFKGTDTSMPYILPHISYSSYRDYNTIYPDWTKEVAEKERMVNYGEYIYLDNNYLITQQMNLYYDGNGGAPTERVSTYHYTLQYSKIDEGGQPIQWKEVSDWSNLESIGNLLKFKLQGLNGERIIFRLSAKDEFDFPVLAPDGSEWLVSSADSYLIGCRCTTPDIVISDCAMEDGVLYAALTIKDYGGNDLLYDNFNREIDKVSATEGSEGSYKITWACGEKTTSMEQIKDYKLGRIANLASSHSGMPQQTDRLNLGPLTNLGGRIYVQVEIKFYYNIQGDYVSVKTPVFVIYTEGPTVSYRYHQLGINSNIDVANENGVKIYGDDVLTIGDFQEKRYVRLKGEYIDEYGSAASREILIDLKTGEVSGLVIQCGSW